VAKPRPLDEVATFENARPDEPFPLWAGKGAVGDVIG
jgi:hypothetical protein